MKVLLSAYACEPDRGSEPGAGWHWALAAAHHHDVVVVTRANNRTAIEAALARVPADRRPRFDYLDLPTVRLKRGGRGMRLYYAQWQRALTTRARELHRAEGFDVAHHVTIAADWLPCGLAHVAQDLPFVWGPVGGATGTPWRLRRWLTPSGLAKEVARAAITGIGRSITHRTVARRAALAVALNSDAAAALRERGIDCVVEQNAVVEPLTGRQGRPARRERTAVFVGRLEGWKGVLLAVDAIARAPGWTLEVVGDGPDRGAAERLAAELGLGGRIRFLGQVPLEVAHDRLAAADALLLPSMHDSAPFAVAEAVASELPVVCLDRGGPADMIRPGGGIAVPAGTGDLPAELAAALETVSVTRPYDGRFSAERLPDLLDRWYRSATERA